MTNGVTDCVHLYLCSAGRGGVRSCAGGRHDNNKINLYLCSEQTKEQARRKGAAADLARARADILTGEVETARDQVAVLQREAMAAAATTATVPRLTARCQVGASRDTSLLRGLTETGSNRCQVGASRDAGLLRELIETDSKSARSVFHIVKPTTAESKSTESTPE